MFTFDALDRDFLSAFQQTRTALPQFHSALEQMPELMSSAVSCSASLSVQSSVDALASAWIGLQHLRARLTSNSIFMRASAVSLMAQECILCTCLESLAAHHSQRDFVADNQLSALSSALWSLIDSRTDTRLLLFTYRELNYEVRLSASPRSLRTDFDKQKLVYTACLDRLCEHIGVDDSRMFRLRAWFVWCVVETLGFDALFHVDVWSCWQYPSTRCTSTRVRKEPSLDMLLPLLGHLTDCVGVADRPPSALASLSLAVASPDERQRCFSAVRCLAGSFAQPVRYAPMQPAPVPTQVNKIYRSLAVLAQLIGVYSSLCRAHFTHGRYSGLPYDPHSSTGAVDIQSLSTFSFHGAETHLQPADLALLKKAAENPDMYMPFRVHAPSAKRLRGLFGEEYPAGLVTDVGFRNLVATRYISYNSPFLLSGEQKYVARVEDLLGSFNQEPRRPQAYFLNPKIYGQNRFRFMDRLPDVWNACNWPRGMGRNFMAVWTALAVGEKKYKIPNIGNLLALQICGTGLSRQLDPCSSARRRLLRR